VANSRESRPVVLVTFTAFDTEHPEIGGALTAAGFDIRLAPRLGHRTEAELIELLDGAVGAIASTDPFTADVMRKSPELRVIARVGVGYDTVDVDAATELGIQVVTTPGGNDQAVADHTVALMLALLRRIPELDADVRAGGWRRSGGDVPRQLTGATVGLVGMGRIGRGVARRLTGFDVELLVHDPALDDSSSTPSVPLEALLECSDIVSLHCPLSASTRHLVDAAALARMKPGAILVNTARGGLVDEAALAEALRAGRLSGAAIDAFESEPPLASPLLGLDNVVLSPHNGGLSDVSIFEMTRRCTAAVIAAVQGGAAPDLLNRPGLDNRHIHDRELNDRERSRR
jgi:phosphoglycerate dehydrogenase-like enzyme